MTQKEAIRRVSAGGEPSSRHQSISQETPLRGVNGVEQREGRAEAKENQGGWGRGAAGKRLHLPSKWTSRGDGLRDSWFFCQKPGHGLLKPELKDKMSTATKIKNSFNPSEVALTITDTWPADVRKRDISLAVSRQAQQ